MITSFGAQQKDGRPESLAAALMEVLVNLFDDGKGGVGKFSEFTLDLGQIFLQEVKDLPLPERYLRGLCFHNRANIPSGGCAGQTGLGDPGSLPNRSSGER